MLQVFQDDCAKIALHQVPSKSELEKNWKQFKEEEKCSSGGICNGKTSLQKNLKEKSWLQRCATVVCSAFVSQQRDDT